MVQHTKALRLGIAGLGLAGTAMTLAAARHPHVQIAGGADPDPALRERFASDYRVRVNSDAVELAGRDDIDAIYVATPHQYHCEHVLAAAHGGKHIIVEKPMALAIADCDHMIAAAEGNNVILIVGHTHAFDPAIRRMKSLLACNEVGALSQISMWNFTDFLYRPRRPAELDSARGGGILFNQIPHQVATAQLLSGREARRIFALTNRLDPTRPTEGGCTALIDFGDGVGASLVYSGYDHFDSDEFHGWIAENGRSKSPNHGGAKRALRGTSAADEETIRRTAFGYGGRVHANQQEIHHHPHFGVLIASCERGDLRAVPEGIIVYSGEGRREIALDEPGYRPGHMNVLNDLCGAVFDGIRPAQDGRFGRETVRICLAIQKSAQERREIS